MGFVAKVDVEDNKSANDDGKSFCRTYERLTKKWDFAPRMDTDHLNGKRSFSFYVLQTIMRSFCVIMLFSKYLISIWRHHRCRGRRCLDCCPGSRWAAWPSLTRACTGAGWTTARPPPPVTPSGSASSCRPAPPSYTTSTTSPSHTWWDPSTSAPTSRSSASPEEVGQAGPEAKQSFHQVLALIVK